MAEEEPKRRLAAILAADVVGYSRMMGADEEGTLARLTAHRRELVDPMIAKRRGRIVKTTGDGLLAEFASVVDAVRCAADVQAGIADRNRDVPESQRLVFRIGINVGDIVEQNDDIFGDGVNIAARLEGIAEAGGIYVSQRVQEDAAGRSGMIFEDLGERPLKNIDRPIRVFRLKAAESAVSSPQANPTDYLSVPARPSIAVMPFQNIGGDPEQEYFADGLTEDINTGLSKLRWFFVIAHSSTFGYKGKPSDARQVARDLRVRYVLEGSVRRAGDRLRISSQLIDTAIGAHVWADRYDRPINDIFAVQDEITSNVVAAIEPRLYEAEGLRFKTQPPDSLDAWGCVVSAMPHIWHWVAQEDDTGVKLLRRAIELDPAYARAHSLLAWVTATRAMIGQSDHRSAFAAALEQAQQAVDLDPDDPWAHLAAGYVYMQSRRFVPAAEELEETLERNPNFALAQVILGLAKGFAGMADEGLQHLDIAARQSPRDHTQAANLSIAGLCHLVAGRYAESATFERRAVQLRPNFGIAWRTLAAACGLAGDADEAARALTQAKRLQPSLTIDWVEKYYPLIRPADRTRYIDGLRRAGLD